jgi:hypothetical protein
MTQKTVAPNGLNAWNRTTAIRRADREPHAGRQACSLVASTVGSASRAGSRGFAAPPESSIFDRPFIRRLAGATNTTAGTASARPHAGTSVFVDLETTGLRAG